MELANIDKVCKRFSDEAAGSLRHKHVPGTPVASLNEMVLPLLKKHGITAGYQTVRSSFEDNGRVIEFATRTQSFEVVSPFLFALVITIARHIRVDVHPSRAEAGEFTVDLSFGYDPDMDVRVKEARFSYSGREFTAVTSEGDTRQLEGSQHGQYCEDEGWLFLNVLSGDLESLIHELLHSKVPSEAISNLDTPINKLGNAVVEMIRTRNPDAWSGWSSELERARTAALDKMAKFDADLAGVIPEGEW